MNDVIKELTISDVDPNETDAQLWQWTVEQVLIPAGIEVMPWMKYSLIREGTNATIQLDIPLVQNATPPRTN